MKINYINKSCGYTISDIRKRKLVLNHPFTNHMIAFKKVIDTNNKYINMVFYGIILFIVIIIYTYTYAYAYAYA